MNQVKSGAVLSYISLLITLVIALLYTPVMIRLLGQAEYGLYALIGSIAAYFSVMDMGLGNAIVRYTARNRAIGDKKAESKLTGMFLTLYSIIGVLTILVGLFFWSKVDSIFGESLSVTEIEKAKIMLIILILNFAISFPLAVFGSIMRAYERFVIVKLIAIVRSIGIPLITLPILLLGYGSVAMVLVTTLVNILCLLFNVYYSFKYLKIEIFFGKIDIKLLKEIIRYSFFVFLVVIVNQIYWNTDQFILGIIAGTVPVAVYAIAMLFINLYMQFSNSISGLFLPRVSMMVARNASKVEHTNMMIKFGRIQYIIMAYILSGFILFGYPFLGLWAGEDYYDAYYIVLIIMLPLTIPLIQNFGISLLQAMNLHGFRSIVFIIIAVLNILITIPLTINLGGLGSAIATSVSLIMGHIIIMNLYYHLKIGINMLEFWKNILHMTIPICISLAFGFLINYLINENTIVLLILKIGLFSGVYFSFLWIFGFNSYEKKLFISILKKFYSIISKLKIALNSN